MRNPLTGINTEAVVERIRTNSVLNPLLWLCGITELTALPAACLSRGYEQIFFSTLVASPVMAALIAYFYFMFRDPNRLQSEDYQLAQQKLLQGTKEEGEFVTINQTMDHKSNIAPAIEVDQPDESASPLGQPALKITQERG